LAVSVIEKNDLLDPSRFSNFEKLKSTTTSTRKKVRRIDCRRASQSREFLVADSPT
ncbi:hypothetical protein T08_9555, partial [Trichinella sp. T8]